MNYLTQTQSLPNFEVRIDGELQVAPQPSITERAVSHFTATFTGVIESTRLELALVIYDRIHGTHYRSIRKSLVSAKRNEAFEQRIGISKR